MREVRQMPLMLPALVALFFYTTLAFLVSPVVAAIWMIVGFFLTARASKVGILELNDQILLSIVAPLVLIKVIVLRIRAVIKLLQIRKATIKDP